VKISTEYAGNPAATVRITLSPEEGGTGYTVSKSDAG
jgi:hypothetical protein